VSMRAVTTSIARVGALAIVLALAACGGGGGSSNSAPSGSSASSAPTTPPVSVAPWPPAANAVALVADQGIYGTAVNTPFVDVTICVPGSSTCQVIDHVMVDTGSYGLRLAASALNAQVGLPAVTAPSGAPMAECAGFVSGFAWGSVRRADVRIGGETALGVPVQVVDDKAAPYSAIPVACSNTGPNMSVGNGAKGILGVGFLSQDCGAHCTASTAPNVYYACTATGSCASSLAPLTSQVTNPVAMFATDNNGVVISMPDVPLGGASRATGLLVFGIGTAANNQLGSAQLYTAGATGSFTTVYKGKTLSGFIDSGSNGIFLHDADIPSCAGGGFYCPPSPLPLSATLTGANGATKEIPFQIESVATLPRSTAAAHLAGDLGLSNSFDWGLPFFFGRTVFVAMQGASTPWGVGPYWAF
jgi:hypothetical protein